MTNSNPFLYLTQLWSTNLEQREYVIVYNCWLMPGMYFKKNLYHFCELVSVLTTKQNLTLDSKNSSLLVIIKRNKRILYDRCHWREGELCSVDGRWLFSPCDSRLYHCCLSRHEARDEQERYFLCIAWDSRTEMTNFGVGQNRLNSWIMQHTSSMIRK
jgi:hypothetical protein